MKDNKLLSRILSLLLAAMMVIGAFPQSILTATAEEITEPNYGTTTFVYVGDNENVTGANLKFWITWGAAATDYAENVGMTVTPSGNSVTLTVDKNTLADATVWMDVYETIGWAKLGSIGSTFSGETYYVYDDSVSTTPPADPDPEPEPEPEPDYGTTTFVYAGSNEDVTGVNLKFWITWGASATDYAENVGMTVTPSGNSVTLTVDKNTLTDATVWMDVYETIGWAKLGSIGSTFSGETYYVYDDSISTTPPAEPEPDPEPDPHTHSYVDGICECGEICAHAEYADGKCTVCGMAEPSTEPEPDYGTTTFVYAGTNESITADNLVAYITWGTEIYNANAEDCGFIVTRDGNTLTLKVDKNVLTDAVWMKIWDDVVWTTWDGINPSFAGETFYLCDGAVVSTTPPTEPDPEPHTHSYVEGVCECGEICTHGEYVDGKCTVCGMAEPSPDPEPTDPEPDDPEADVGKATFIYEGSDAAVTAENLTVFITWGTDPYNQNAEECGFTVTREGKTVTLQVDKNKLTDSTVWLKVWEDVAWTTWDSISCTFSGETYHLQDGGVYTMDSSEPGETEPEEPTYQFTVHCYGEGYQVGAWMALVEDGVEIAWTPSSPAKTATFENLEDGWTSAVISWNLTDTYNRFGCTIGIDDPWASSKYNYDFTEPSGEIWIVPGDPRVYTSKEAALEGMQTEYEAPYSFTIHCKGEGYQLGAWLELVENGEITAWTPEEDGITVALENPEDGWTSVKLIWDNPETYNRLGFILGTTDPWTGTRYTYEFDSPTGEEVWIVPGYGGAYSTKEEALANAWSYYYQFKIHCYGEGYQVGAWMAKVVDGEETAWTSSAGSVIRAFGNPQDGWTTATVAWSSKTLYNRLGFTIGQETPWESSNYSYDFTERIGEIWILPDDPTVYLSEEDALEALNNPASAKYSFHIHCYGEDYQIGAWLAQVQGTEEVEWTESGQSVIAAFTPEADGWSEVWVKWNLPEDYNRLGFTIGVDDPWASESYTYDFKECPAEIWIVPGDLTIYLSQEEAEEAMTPGVEMTIPPETEPPATESVEMPKQEDSSGSAPVVIVLGTGTAAAGGLGWWLIQFLRKRKK